MESMAKSRSKTVPVLPWMRNPLDIELFDDCSLSLVPLLDPRLKEALHKMDIQLLFPVQVAMWHETIGPGAFERDICVNSPTGSGKTLAYALPIVQILSTRKIRRLRALVVLPTRDLALQVKEVFAAIAPAVGLTVGVAIGQSSISDEVSKLIEQPKLDMLSTFYSEDWQTELQSSVDILVATPGRLLDHINATKGFSMEHLCYLVVDETDRLLREAYQSWLPTVIQLACTKNQAVFKEDVTVPSMFNSLTTMRRVKRLKAFREGKIEVLIASDAMTRGMDVEGVRNVINYDMPTYVKAFIHRAGRTARARNNGRCFTLLRKDEVKRFTKILSKADKMVCNVHPLPANAIERLRPIYYSALEKLKQFVDSKKGRKYGIRLRSARIGDSGQK